MCSCATGLGHVPSDTSPSCMPNLGDFWSSTRSFPSSRGKLGTCLGPPAPWLFPAPWQCCTRHAGGGNENHRRSLHWEPSPSDRRSIIFRERAALVEVQSLWPPLRCCLELFSSPQNAGRCSMSSAGEGESDNSTVLRYPNFLGLPRAFKSLGRQCGQRVGASSSAARPQCAGRPRKWVSGTAVGISGH